MHKSWPSPRIRKSSLAMMLKITTALILIYCICAKHFIVKTKGTWFFSKNRLACVHFLKGLYTNPTNRHGCYQQTRNVMSFSILFSLICFLMLFNSLTPNFVRWEEEERRIRAWLRQPTIGSNPPEFGPQQRGHGHQFNPANFGSESWLDYSYSNLLFVPITELP